jgi:hypothetical protein
LNAKWWSPDRLAVLQALVTVSCDDRSSQAAAR